MSQPLPNPGDEVFLGAMTATLRFWGIVADLDNPSMVRGSFELSGKDGSVTFDALIGPKGDPGQPSPIVNMQWDVYTDSSQLPNNLTNTPADIGKAWWIGNVVWTWTGTGWFQGTMGTAGPTGPAPNIHPSAQAITDPSTATPVMTTPVDVQRSGTDQDPGLLFRFDASPNSIFRGPTGASGTIRGASDYDNSLAPGDGMPIVWSAARNKFMPFAFDLLGIKAYSVPESAFTGYQGFGTQQQIGAYQVPPQPYDWKPLVLGHFYASGVDLNAGLIIGVEALLGDPVTGQRVGRGFGNISNYATMLPHFSTPSRTSDAITPDNSLAHVPANHTGFQGTVYFRLFNDGAYGEYVYNPQNSQALIICWPTTTPQIAPGS